MARMMDYEAPRDIGPNSHKDDRTPPNRIVGRGPHYYDPVKGDLQHYKGGRISTSNRFSMLDDLNTCNDEAQYDRRQPDYDFEDEEEKTEN